jgi:hypothetical protein
MCFSYESAPIHRLFAQCDLHNAIAVPMADEEEAFKRGVMKGNPTMTKRIEKVFSRNHAKHSKNQIAMHLHAK